MGRRYCLISPCRNEEEFCRRTLDSVVEQTELPARWVIVDDGSTDSTPGILAEYAAKHDWIQIVTRGNRGERAVGPGVIEAFYAGYDSITPEDYDFLCKLDLDLELPRGYFAELMNRMEQNPRLGNCSGKPYFPGPSNVAKTFDGELISEGCGDENAIGASKFYRVTCFRQIGGFVRQVMWDGIDGHRCRMKGWIAESWDDPELRFLHLRPMGSSHKGIITGRLRHGFGQYFMGTGLGYMTASALYRMTRSPHIVGGAAMWWGYVKSAIDGVERYDDPKLRAFVREFHRNCLLKGKARATAELNRRQAAVWNPTL